MAVRVRDGIVAIGVPSPSMQALMARQHLKHVLLAVVDLRQLPLLRPRQHRHRPLAVTTRAAGKAQRARPAALTNGTAIVQLKVVRAPHGTMTRGVLSLIMQTAKAGRHMMHVVCAAEARRQASSFESSLAYRTSCLVLAVSVRVFTISALTVLQS